jgi:hypothetical protein
MSVLERHGTRLCELKPSAVVAAAEADVALRRRKNGAGAPIGTPYCFHRRHVARASCACDLIERAIKDRYAGVGSEKRITRILYGDEELLRAAYAAASCAGAAS